MAATTALICFALAGTELDSQNTAASVAILMAHFTTRPIPEICAMGGITPQDCTKSGAFLVILGLGGECGLEQGLEEALKQDP